MSDFSWPHDEQQLDQFRLFPAPGLSEDALEVSLGGILADVDSGGTPAEVAVVQQCPGQLQFRRGQGANISQPSVGERNFRTKGRVGTVFG